jgi:nicotinamidase-related amidase
VNDNFGQWRSDFRQQVEHCQQENALGRELTQLLRPSPEDYFVLKPKHSGFFSTTLDLLLTHLGATRLILTGFSSEICVLYTANDAYMRDFEIFVPQDCVAAETRRGNSTALQQMERWLKADIRDSSKIRFS